MNRRKVLATILGVGTPTLAGCTTTSSNQQTQTPTSEPALQPADSLPTVEWDESWIQGDKYKLEVSGNLRNTDRLLFKLNRGKTLTTVTADNGQSYNRTIAGPNTEHGPVKLGEIVSAEVPRDPVNRTVDTFGIGSQDQASFPLHLQGLSAGTIPDLENSNTIERSFTQDFNGNKTVLTTQVPENLYNYYKNRKRTLDWGGYVSAGYDDPYIKSIVDGLRQYGERRNHSDRQIVNHAVTLVQKMEYTPDKVATGYDEYPKYPIETIVDRGGDCEDSVILLAEILRKLGYGTVLLVIRDANHMALGVAGDDSLSGSYYEHQGQQYYYLETTSGGWEIGQVPPDVRNSNGQAEIVEVNSRPVLAHKWAVQAPPEGGAKVDVGLQNTGDAPVTMAEVEMRFETRNGNVVASKRKSVPRIGADKFGEVLLNLLPPDDEALRGRVRLYLDGKLHDESISKYSKPIKTSNGN